MVATVLSFVCLIVLLVTRSRLERTEQRLRELDLTLDKLRIDLADQARRLAHSEEQLAQRLIASALGAQPSDASPPRAAAVAQLQPPASPLTASPLAAAAAHAHALVSSPPPSAAADHADGVTVPGTLPLGSTALPGTPLSAADTPASQALPAALPASDTDPLGWALHAAREFLFGGNTVVRVGIIVLLVGVTLLLRWATEHSRFPIELRLAAVAVGAMALLGFGFTQREGRRGFALTLQGGGIAALYLVVFFAFRSYGLRPAPLAFALLCAIALCSGVLSVQQDSPALVFIAQLFGFAAPILASTGEGSHVALFSYYLLLNALTFGVALYKAWRALNLLGFVFTFGVATSWGVLRYEPSLFASTEPFLLAFFAVYVAIPVLFALRHPGTPQGWVDGGLGGAACSS
jgi:uncharacterized membrane protein